MFSVSEIGVYRSTVHSKSDFRRILITFVEIYLIDDSGYIEFLENALFSSIYLKFHLSIMDNISWYLGLRGAIYALNNVLVHKY